MSAAERASRVISRAVPVRRTVTLARLFLAAFLAACVAQAGAQDKWPTRPIRIIVPTVPGIAPDIFARLYAEQLAKSLGVAVTVENRAGAAAIIGTDAVAKAPADGYTILYAFNAPFTMNPHLYSRLPYDAANDLVPLIQNLKGAYFIVAAPDSPFRSMREYLDMARERQGRMTYASYGVGSAAHLAFALVEDMTGVRLTHVPYKASAISDVIGGTVHVTTEPNGSIVPFIQSGKVRPIAYTGGQRHPVLPNVPAVAETIPGFEVLGWHGMFVRAGTAREIIARLHAELARITMTPDIRKRMTDVAFEPATASPDETAAIIRRESAAWAKVIKSRDIRLD